MSKVKSKRDEVKKLVAELSIVKQEKCNLCNVELTTTVMEIIKKTKATNNMVCEELSSSINKIIKEDSLHISGCALRKKVSRTLNIKEKRSCLYLIRSGDSLIYKIGITSNFKDRIHDLQVGNPELLNVIKIIYTTNYSEALSLEKFLHNKFNDKHCRGEWFKLDDNDVVYIKNQKPDQ